MGVNGRIQCMMQLLQVQMFCAHTHIQPVPCTHLFLFLAMELHRLMQKQMFSARNSAPNIAPANNEAPPTMMAVCTLMVGNCATDIL